MATIDAAALLGDTHRLLVFRAVAQTGSFSAAARAMQLSQPAISRHIAALEDRLQVPLFTRGSSGVTLTTAGGVLVEAVDQLVGVLDQATEVIGRTNDLTLAVQPAIAESWLAPKLRELRRTMAPTSLTVTIFDRDDDLGDLDHDVSIRFTPKLGAHEHSTAVVDECVFPVASPDVAARFGLGPDSNPSALLNGPDILLADDRGRSWLSWSEWFSHHDTEWSPDRDALAFPTYSLLLQQALAGRGVTLGWRTLLGDLVDRDMLVQVGPEVSRPGHAYHLVWPNSLRRHDGLSRLRRWLESQF